MLYNVLLCVFLVAASVTPAPGDLIQVLIAKKFNMLAAVLAKNNLTTALKGTGPFTIFAPTDEAFKTMRPDVKQYLKDNPKMLPILLLNHVIGNKLETNKLENEMAIKSLAQENLRFNINEKNSAKILTVNGVVFPSEPSFKTSNGDIYTVNEILSCAYADTIPEVLVYENCSLLIEALALTKLGPELKKDGPFTLFAPSNQAFEAIPAVVKAKLLSNPEKLKNILLGHCVPGTHFTNGLSKGTLNAINKSTIQFAVDGKTPKVNDAHIIESNILAGNGVIHIIDKVLI